ncbi:MAG: hypothetical protein ACREH6_14745, partial [Geminicoccaceae bacterium]
RWQPAAALAGRRTDLASRLERVHSQQPLQVADAVEWAAARGAPVALATFWKRPAPVERDPADVPAAFTYAQWAEGVGALQSDLAGAPTEAAARAFAQQFLAEHAAAWQRFVTGFERGALAWRQQPSELIALLGSETSPYAELWDSLKRDLFPLIGQPGLPAWPEALASTLDKDWPAIEPKLRALFFELAQDTTGEAGYQLVAAIYDPRRQAGPQLATFRELQNALETPPSTAAPLTLDGQRAWRVVRQPLELWLRLANLKAGDFLERRWQDQVVGPSQRLPADRREAFLIGPNGQVAAFKAMWLSPFLAEAGGAPAAPLAIPPPVSEEFSGFLARAAQAGGRQEQGPIYAGRVLITGPATFGPLESGLAGITFTLSCLNLNQTASSQGQPELTIAWSPTSCFEVRISIAPPEAVVQSDPGLAGALLERTYAGPGGFLDFIADFRSGPRSFALGAFAPDVPRTLRAALAGYGVTSVAVPIRLELSEPMIAFLNRPNRIDLPTKISPPPFAQTVNSSPSQ